jgi:hypothetical protein
LPASAVETEDEEAVLDAVNRWMDAAGMRRGERSFEIADAEGRQVATLDLAWPRGLQEGLGEPVALLLNESAEVIAAANAAGFRCYTTVGALKRMTQSGTPSAVGD